MDLPTPLKTLPFRAFALRVGAFPSVALALALALAFTTTFTTSWLLLYLKPIVVLLLLLLLLESLRSRLLTRSTLAVFPRLVHCQRRERAH